MGHCGCACLCVCDCMLYFVFASAHFRICLWIKVVNHLNKLDTHKIPIIKTELGIPVTLNAISQP